MDIFKNAWNSPQPMKQREKDLSVFSCFGIQTGHRGYY